MTRVTERLFRQATVLKADFTAAYVGLGVALARQGRNKAAAEAFRTAVVLDPGNVKAHLNLVTTLVELGDSDAGLASIRAAIRLAPTEAVTHRALGDALARLGRPEEAGKSYQEALRLNPNDVAALSGLGFSYLNRANQLHVAWMLRSRGQSSALLSERLGQWPSPNEKSRPSFDPSRTDALYQEAQRMETLALPLFERAVQLKPDDARHQLGLGVSLRAAGRLEEAKGTLETSIRVDPNLASSHEALGECLLDLSWPNLEKLIAGQQRDPVLVEQGLEHLRTAITLDPKSRSNAWARLISELHTMGRKEEAERAVNESFRALEGPGN